MYIILALIVVVAFALWRSSKQLKQQQDPTNRFKAKPRAKAAYKRKTKATPQAHQQQHNAYAKTYHTKSINLHHPNYASDDIAQTDRALGLEQEYVKPVAPVMTQPIMLYLVAPGEEIYGGFHLLQNLLSTGLRMNEQGVFEKSITANNTKRVLFKVASMREPGTFPQDKIDGYTTKGLIFFMEPNENQQVMLQTMESMLAQITLTQARLGGNIFTPDKTLLEPQDFKRYADYICDVAVMS